VSRSSCAGPAPMHPAGLTACSAHYGRGRCNAKSLRCRLSCCTSRESAWLLMSRAEARGLSGILMASTPTDFRKRAPSNFLTDIGPFGGDNLQPWSRISPAAIFSPIWDRFSARIAGGSRERSVGLHLCRIGFCPRLAYAQSGLHDTYVVRRGPAASSHQAHNRQPTNLRA